MKEYLDQAVKAAMLAGNMMQEMTNQRHTLKIEQKSANDFVSQVDRRAERLISEHLLQSFPEHHILGEEYGCTADHTRTIGSPSSEEFQWIVDPLDGTTNYLRAIPHYAVSIALLINNSLSVGVVFDPAKSELFTAIEGQGAKLNGAPIECSNSTSLYGALLATGVPFSGQRLAQIDHFTEAMVALLEQQTSGLRRLGSASLDLAYVAAGRYDGFWEAGLQSWDVAAGALIAKEAGAIVTDFQGEPEYLKSGNIIATAPKVANDMQHIVENAYLKNEA